MKKIFTIMTLGCCVFSLSAFHSDYIRQPAARITSGVTYYSTGSGDPAVLTNWNTSRDGSGSSPANFNSGSTFVIEAGDNMSTTTTWGISGTSSKLQIEDGGTLTANHHVTLAIVSTFQIDNGGTCIQNVVSSMGSNIFSGTEIFGPSSNFIYNFVPSGTSAPSAPGYGNLTLNTTTNTGNFGWGGTINKIQGNFSVLSTGTGTIRHALTAGSAITVTIGGNFSLSGTNTNFWLSSGNGTCNITVGGDVIVSGSATLDLANSSGAGTLNIGGNFNQTGGTLKSNTAVSSINFTGSAKTLTQSSGTLSGNNINWTISSGASLSQYNNIPVSASRSLIVAGTLNCGNSLVSGAGSFTLNSGGTLGIASAEGITSSGLTGNIQVSGTRTFDTGANYTYNGSGAQSAGNGLPATVNNLTAGGTTNLTLCSDETVSGNLTITSGGRLTIPSANSLAIAGNTDLSGAECLVIKSDAASTGSFLCDGIINGSGTVRVERFITHYSTEDDGWHLISCPVNSFTVSGSTFEPSPGNDDLYRFDETQYTWINWQGSPFDFGTEEGYLCAYKTDGTRFFTGILNNENHTISDNSYNPATGGGWHIIPNPFPCAFAWNSAGMSDIGYASTASGKILNGGRSYTDVYDGGIIPAMNGFVMQVSNAINAITIPKSLRIPGSMSWYKKSTGRLLMLTAQSAENATYQETVVRFEENASEGFDQRYDSPFLSATPMLPMLYTTLDDNTELSLNTFPALTNSRVIPVHFIKGSSAAYTILASRLDELGNDVSLSLEDLMTGSIQDLRQNPSYAFTSAEGDKPHRFLLHIGAPNAVDEIAKEPPFNIHSYGHTLYITNITGKFPCGEVFVYNLLGQQLLKQKLNETASTVIRMNALTGYCIVKVITGRKVWSDKIFLQ